MSKRDDTVSLSDMLNHAREAVALLGGRSQSEFNADRTAQLALTRLVEIIGEAANRITPETRERHAHIPWRQMIIWATPWGFPGTFETEPRFV